MQGKLMLTGVMCEVLVGALCMGERKGGTQ